MKTMLSIFAFLAAIVLSGCSSSVQISNKGSSSWKISEIKNLDIPENCEVISVDYETDSSTSVSTVFDEVTSSTSRYNYLVVHVRHITTREEYIIHYYSISGGFEPFRIIKINKIPLENFIDD